MKGEIRNALPRSARYDCVAADWGLVENGADNIKPGRATMRLILIIVILVLLLGGGGFGYSRYGYRGGVGIGGIKLIILIVYLLVGRGRF